MGYIKADALLPPELLRRIQDYAEGQLLYIPRRDAKRSDWGSLSGARLRLQRRNARIRRERRLGSTVQELAERYYLSEKSIQRILRDGAPSEASDDWSEEGIPLTEKTSDGPSRRAITGTTPATRASPAASAADW